MKIEEKERATQLIERLFAGATIDLTQEPERMTPEQYDALFVERAEKFLPEVPKSFIKLACGDVSPSFDEIRLAIENELPRSFLDAFDGDEEIAEKFKVELMQLCEKTITELRLKKQLMLNSRASERRGNVESLTEHSREQLRKFAQGDDTLLEMKDIKKALIDEGKASEDFNPFEDTIFVKQALL